MKPSRPIRYASYHRVFGVFLVVLFSLLLYDPTGLQGVEVKSAAVKTTVFVYPHKLTSKDVLLADGKNGKAIPIKSNSTLIWVDHNPGARFAHPTEFLLISEKGTQVIKGTWWPILNGKDLFRGEKASNRVPDKATVKVMRLTTLTLCCGFHSPLCCLHERRSLSAGSIRLVEIHRRRIVLS